MSNATSEEELTQWTTVCWAVAMGILSVVTVIGNLAVLLSYYLDKNIRQPSNYFIFSLAVSDLVSVLSCCASCVNGLNQGIVVAK